MSDTEEIFDKPKTEKKPKKKRELTEEQKEALRERLKKEGPQPLKIGKKMP
jgi:hypothetical protein